MPILDPGFVAEYGSAMTSAASYPAETNYPDLARKAHRTLEPLHALTYFSPEPGERYTALGIKGGMRGYFASRAAAFGRVPADVRPVKLQLIGNYGLKVWWSDGHHTGIYTFEALRGGSGRKA